MQIITEYRYLRSVSSQFPHWRPVSARVIGARLNPQAITDAWYAQDCPPQLDTSSLPLRVRVQWAVSMFLRGVEVDAS